MFDTIEQRHAHDIGSGEDGKRLYEDLLSAVRDCGDTQAAEEFESRFFPLLNPDKTSRKDAIGRGVETTDEERTGNQQRGGWRWVAAASAAALVLGALLLGFNGLRVKTADQSNIAVSSIPAPHATVSPATTSESAPGWETETPIAADDAELAAPVTMTGPAQVPATEPELNPER